MKRVLLLSSNITVDPYPVYPLGAAVIAAALTGSGHLVEQFDFLAAAESEAALRERIAHFRPDYVCISMRNLDNCDSLSSTSYPEIVRRLVAVVRDTVPVPVVIGGPAFSILPEELLAYTGADYGVVGEGEQLICTLLEQLAAGQELPPLQRADRLLEGGEMTSPLYRQDLVGFYLEKSGMINLQTKRGCPHGCIYCSYPTLEGTRYRCRDAVAVVDDLQKIKTDHGADSFFFTDSVFNDSDGHYLQVVEEILRRNLAIHWCCYVRPEGIGRRELSLMKRAGLYAVELGTDAASDTTLHALGKGFSFADALAVNEACAAEELPSAHFVMFGGPGETADTVAEGLANIDRLARTVVFAFSGIRILPETPLHRIAIRDNIVTAGQSLLEPAYYLSPQVGTEIMNGMITAAFRGRRDRIFPPSDAQKRLAIMHRFGYRGLLWDTLIATSPTRRSPQKKDS